MSNQWFRKKSIEAILKNSVSENQGHTGEGNLKKVLNVRDLIALGIGNKDSTKISISVTAKL